jgi:ABC-type oligopeptide transport system ATPase subunit
MTAPLVTATGLSKAFEVGGGGFFGLRKPLLLRAVDDVALNINAGETLGLVGESGCGKSTLGRLLIRLIEPTAGRITFDGTDITALRRMEMRAHRRSMQIIFQDPYGALNPRMSVEDIIAEPLIIHGAKQGAETRRQATQMLEKVGLPARALDRFPHEFSGGQRQRIGIARALAMKPEVLVADEPVSALDVSVQAQVLELLRDLQARLGLSILFITHDLRVAAQLCDEVAVMRNGVVEEAGPIGAVFADPKSAYTRSLIEAIPGRALFSL